MAQIHILSGKRQGTVVPLSRSDPTTFGHRPTASVPVDDAWVSWDHAQISWDGKRYWVEDLGSTNGTWVNYNRIQRESIKDHDVINLGKTQILFVADASQPQLSPPPPSAAHGVMQGADSGPLSPALTASSPLSGWPASPGTTPAGGAPAVPGPAAPPPVPFPVEQQRLTPAAPGADSDQGYAPIEADGPVLTPAPSAGFQPIGPTSDGTAGVPESSQFKLGRKTEAEIEALEALLKTGGNQDLNAFVGDPISEADLGQELEQLAGLTPQGDGVFAPMPAGSGLAPAPMPILDLPPGSPTSASNMPPWLQDTVQTTPEVPIPEVLPLDGPPPVDELAETKGLDQPPGIQATQQQEQKASSIAPPPLPRSMTPPPLSPIAPPPLAPVAPPPPPPPLATITPGPGTTFPTTPTPPPPPIPAPPAPPNNGQLVARIASLEASFKTSEETLADREIDLARAHQRVDQLERESVTMRSALEQRAADDSVRGPISDGDAARLALQEARVQELEVERNRLSDYLDELTTEMIDKENQIEELQAKLSRAQSAQSPQNAQPVASPENESLEFLP